MCYQLATFNVSNHKWPEPEPTCALHLAEVVMTAARISNRKPIEVSVRVPKTWLDTCRNG